MELIRSGDAGSQVHDVQQRLLALGHRIDAGETSQANFGASTEAAIRSFQRERGLPVDGLVGPDTWTQLLEAGYALGDRTLYLREPAFRGDDVRQLQEMLNALGFDAGREDGIHGEATDRAVREFQRNVGAGPDGIVGRATLSALDRLRPPVGGPSRAVIREEEDVRTMTAKLTGSVVAIDPELPPDAGGDEREIAEALADDLAGALRSRGARPVILGADGAIPGDRARYANEVAAAVCISVRPDPGATTWTCFCFGAGGTHSPAGRRLAELIRDEIAARVGDAAVDRRSVAILRETRMPAVQIEPPLRALTRPEDRRAAMEAVATGVERFLGTG